MGKKSEKKVRTDRINILRKQYDSFLEEDKKRKERNDFILQRLDKMRYTTSAAFQLRPKIFAEHSQPSFNRFEYRPENIRINDVIPVSHVHQQTIQVQPNLQLDIPRQFDDISILREISKKYILIPKSRTFIPENYVIEGTHLSHDIKPVFSEPKSNTVDNGDWRSKYDILEQLKNKEKEENNNELNKKEAMASNEPSYKNAPEVNNVKDYEIQNNKLDDDFTLYKSELPEKDIPSKTFVVENELATVDKLEINENPSKPETNTDQVLKSPESNANTYTSAEQIQNIESNAIENNVPVAEEAHYVSQQEQNAVYDQHGAQEYMAYNENEQSEEYQNYPNEYDQQHPESVPHQEIIPQTQNNDIYVNENEYSPIQTINPSELVQEIYSEPEVKHDQDTMETEYPIDVIDVAEFTPEENVQLHDGVNINPEYVPNQESYDTSNVAEYLPNQEAYDTSNAAEYMPNQVTYEQNNVEDINDQQNIAATAEHVDNSGIEAFDAEQKEMFYSEQQGAYDQQAGAAYDPEYVPNEQYPENYYGQHDQQEAYPVEINEHEETSQLYDPNYEQQYAPTQQQEYVEPQVYEQHQQQFEQTQQQLEQNQLLYEQNQQQPDQYEQQYEQPALYEQMQEGYEQYAYEQQNTETIQDVEQLLDKEEGYVEEKKAPIAVEKKAAVTAEKKAPVTVEKKAPVTVEKKAPVTVEKKVAKKAVKPKT